MLPQLVVYAAIGVFIAIQHAHRRFLVPSAGPIVENVGLVATVAIVALTFGTGWEVDNVPPDLVLLLAAGSGFAVILHGVVQFFGAWRASGGIAIGADWRDPDVKALSTPTKHSLGWTGVVSARHFALIVAAGFAGAGAVQAFEIAILAYFVPVALIGRPIAAATLPRLSRSQPDRGSRFMGYLAALRLAACVAVPAGVAMTLLARPIADAIARGEFDSRGATDLVAFAIAGLGLGAAGEALFEVARQATMAQGDGRSLRRSNIVRALTANAGIPIAVVLLDGPTLLFGLGLVVSVGDGAAFAAAHLSLRARRGRQPIADRYWPRITAASLLAVVPVALVVAHISSGSPEVRLLAVGLATMALYAWAFALLTHRGMMLRALYSSLRSEELL
jgi:putative peptidoglycan lipid II flippase